MRRSFNIVNYTEEIENENHLILNSFKMNEHFEKN